MRELRTRGFSLGEVLVAFLILAFVSVLLVGVVPATILGLRAATERSTACLLAEAELEQLRRSGFGQLQASSEPFPTISKLGTEYTVQVELGPAVMSNGLSMEEEVAKTVRVTVTWNSRNGPQRYVASAVTFRRI